MLPAKEVKDYTLRCMKVIIEDLITKQADKGSFQLYLNETSESLILFNLHPEKQKIIDLLRENGYDVYYTSGNGLMIDWG